MLEHELQAEVQEILTNADMSPEDRSAEALDLIGWFVSVETSPPLLAAVVRGSTSWKYPKRELWLKRLWRWVR